MHSFGVLDHGYIEMYDMMGDDLRIVNMARQSFGKYSVELNEKDKGLINYLMKHRHGTPFEGVVFHFQVKCPIFVAREWFRHRISSYNEYSGRYSKMIKDFYIPAPEQMRTQTGKPGNYSFKTIEGRKGLFLRKFMNAYCHSAWYAYEFLLKMLVAKEVSRMVLPVNIYTQFSWIVNLRSLMNFMSLRSDERAMFEIREYSKRIEQMVETVVPVAYKAFVDNGRIAP